MIAKHSKYLRELLALRSSAARFRPDGDRMLQLIFDVVAAVEKSRYDMILRRLARAKREGKQIGRPLLKLDLDKARRCLRAGVSIREAARVLKTSSTTLHRRLNQKRY
jgi:DNA invertase Pin-like site-specific DNA recombinase